MFFQDLSGAHSSVEPATPQAGRIANLWWVMFYVSVAVLALVTAALIYAVFRRRSAREQTAPVDLSPNTNRERKATRAAAVALAVTIAILFVLLGLSFTTGRAVSFLSNESPLEIKAVGHRWWWEFQYVDPVPSRGFITANELRLPQGRQIVLTLTSNDVIHSFWAPNLMGKKDLIPGQESRLIFRPEKQGVFRGQCAEFCGFQHAQMGFLVLVESDGDFSDWYNHESQQAVQPSNDSEKRGRQVFLSSTCVMCHTIGGTPANSNIGPPLTHLASRTSIAAATLTNSRENLAKWVTDSQKIKPGNRMPPNVLGPENLDDLLNYLTSLK